jgi:NitT/TauT family transport system substrate-binding protein
MVAVKSAFASGGNDAKTKSPQELKKMTLRLNWTVNGWHAPIFLAYDKGWFKDEGIDLKISEGSGSTITAKLTGTGSADIGLCDFASVCRAVTEGIPIRAIYPVHAINDFALFTMDQKINTFKDLEGKTIGTTPGEGGYQLWGGICEIFNIDQKKINIITMDDSARYNAFYGGRIDAMFGGANAYLPVFEAAGKNVKTFLYSDYGLSTVGITFISNNINIKNEPEWLTKFLKVVAKGFAYGVDHQEEAIDCLKKYFPNIDPKLEIQSLRSGYKISFRKDSKTFGNVTDKEWKETFDLLVKYMGVNGAYPVDAFYTNELLPPDLPPRPVGY